MHKQKTVTHSLSLMDCTALSWTTSDEMSIGDNENRFNCFLFCTVPLFSYWPPRMIMAITSIRAWCFDLQPFVEDTPWQRLWQSLQPPGAQSPAEKNIGTHHIKTKTKLDLGGHQQMTFSDLICWRTHWYTAHGSHLESDVISIYRCL